MAGHEPLSWRWLTSISRASSQQCQGSCQHRTWGALSTVQGQAVTPIRVLWSRRPPPAPVPRSGTGPRQGAGRAGDGSRSPVLSPRHRRGYRAAWKLLGHTAWSPRATVGDAGGQGLTPIPLPVKPPLQGGRRRLSRASWGAAGLGAASAPVPHYKPSVEETCN